MQPNQPYPPTPDPSQSNEPPVEPTEAASPLDNTPSVQPVAPQLPTAPIPTSVPLSPFEQQYQAAVQQPPTRKKSRKGIIVASVIVSLLLIGGGAAAYLWMQDQNDPQKRFYRAVENHLSTTYIQQDYTQTTTIANTATIKIDATSDFTDPKSPKSYIEYERLTDEQDQVTSAGKLVVLDDTEYYANASKLLSFTFGDSVVNTKTDQWYQVKAESFIAGLVFDPMSLRNNINVPTGEFLVGNFDKSTRSQLMDFIKTKNVYSIQSSEDTTIDGKKATKYTLTINADLASELNQKAIAALGLDPGTKKKLVTIEDGQTNTLWVSQETDRIIKAELTRDSTGKKEDGSKSTDVSTINISYPTNVSNIAKPATNETLPWTDLQ